METFLFAILIQLLLLGGSVIAQAPGTPNPDWPHVVVSESGGWRPAPGYDWVDPDSKSNFSVRWEPGRAYWDLGRITWPHIIASNTEGSWQPEPGYVWTNLDVNGRPIPGSFYVRWEPGRAFSYLGNNTWPHVIASNIEGSWQPEPGYVWRNLDANYKPINFAVNWEPGRSYSYLDRIVWPHVVASTTEGSWEPESGYEWAHLDNQGNPLPGDLTVVSSAERAAEMARARALNDRWAKYLKQIQDAKDYPNWSAPPYDLYLSRRPN